MSMIPIRGVRRARGLLAVLIACAIDTAGYVSSHAQTPAPTAGTEEPAAAAAVVTQDSWAPEALEELLAPIALYPDPLLGQILAASVNPQEVLDCGAWLVENENLQGDALDAAAQEAGFGPAMLALVRFPTVVDMMCQEIDWTKQIGSAFTSDQKGVLDAVQRLRAQAAEVGNLKSSSEQTVESTTENNTVIIEVEPADPTIVYVPQYDPQVVYTTPPPSGPSAGEVLLAFGVGIAIGAAIADSYCYPHWGAGAVYFGPRPFYPAAYAYRPVYGPAFHPCHHYAPPAGYRYNHQTNVVINNNNYYNRFDHNANLHGGATRSPLASKDRGASAGTGRDRGGASNSRPSATQPRAAQQPVGGSGGTRSPAVASDRAKAPSAHSDRSQHVDRGYGGSTRGAGGDASARHSQTSSGASTSARGSALSGASQHDSGSFERASSARGHASASGGQAARSSGGGRRR